VFESGDDSIFAGGNQVNIHGGHSSVIIYFDYYYMPSLNSKLDIASYTVSRLLWRLYVGKHSCM